MNLKKKDFESKKRYEKVCTIMNLKEGFYAGNFNDSGISPADTCKQEKKILLGLHKTVVLD